MRIPLPAEQSTLRSAQVVSAVGTVLIAAFGGTFVFMHLMGPARPLFGADVIMTIGWLLAGLLVFWRWRVGGRELLVRSADLWKQTMGSDEARKHIVGDWASRRPRYLRPLVGCTLFGLMGAAFTGSLTGLLAVTVLSLAACVLAFPTAGRATRMLAAVGALAAAS